jgi:hypothetical protein
MQKVVRVARIELASQPWEGRILPLNHTRMFSYFNKRNSEKELFV